jgi:HlyD family secretion protein
MKSALRLSQAPEGDTPVERLEATFADLDAPRKRWPWMLGAGVLALVVLGGVYLATRDKTPPAQPAATGQAAAPEESKGKTIPTVTVLAPKPQTVTAQVQMTGTIAARYDQPVGVEGEGGRISGIYVEAGDRVGQGQLLARINTDVLRPQVAQLAASLEEARANAALAQADYERARSVSDIGAISREELDRRRAQAATSAARARVVAAQLNEAQARLARTEIRAPSGGVILERNAEVGQTAMAGGQPLFRLARGGEVELRAQVAEQDMPRLAPGQDVRVTISGVDRAFNGNVRLLSPIIDPQTRLGAIKVALPSDPLLRPGAFARATVSAGQTTTPVLPQAALLADADGAYVMVVNEKNVVQRRPVEVGGTTPQGVIIRSGLNGNDRVIASAGAFLRAGETVKPVLAGAKS